jgi:hypothetical protein
MRYQSGLRAGRFSVPIGCLLQDRGQLLVSLAWAETFRHCRVGSPGQFAGPGPAWNRTSLLHSIAIRDARPADRLDEFYRAIPRSGCSPAESPLLLYRQATVAAVCRRIYHQTEPTVFKWLSYSGGTFSRDRRVNEIKDLWTRLRQIRQRLAQCHGTLQEIDGTPILQLQQQYRELSDRFWKNQDTSDANRFATLKHEFDQICQNFAPLEELKRHSDAINSLPELIFECYELVTFLAQEDQSAKAAAKVLKPIARKSPPEELARVLRVVEQVLTSENAARSTKPGVRSDVQRLKDRVRSVYLAATKDGSTVGPKRICPLLDHKAVPLPQETRWSKYGSWENAYKNAQGAVSRWLSPTLKNTR